MYYSPTGYHRCNGPRKLDRATHRPCVKKMSCQAALANARSPLALSACHVRPCTHPEPSPADRSAISPNLYRKRGGARVRIGAFWDLFRMAPPGTRAPRHVDVYLDHLVLGLRVLLSYFLQAARPRANNTGGINT